MKQSRFVMMLLTLFVSMASYAQSISGTVTDDLRPEHLWYCDRRSGGTRHRSFRRREG